MSLGNPTENKAEGLSLFQKINYIFDKKQKKYLVLLGFMILLGGVFETFSVGMLVPVVGVILDPKSLQEAISDWEKDHEGQKLSDAEWVDLIFRGISDLDSNSLNYIKNCKKLSLSSKFITKIPDLHFDN